MKTKNAILGIVTILAICLMTYSCKKEKKDDNTNDQNQARTTTAARDNSTAESVFGVESLKNIQPPFASVSNALGKSATSIVTSVPVTKSSKPIVALRRETLIVPVVPILSQSLTPM